MLSKTSISHKSGFVSIVGNSNVGKSTLMNYLTGEKLSIITSKAQTTRHRIIGIVNTSNMQIVYSDTPGMLKPHNELQKKMVYASESVLHDTDILLYVTDVVEKIRKNFLFLQRIQEISIPILLIINKVDLLDQKKLEQKVNEWGKILPHAEIIPLSVLYRFQTNFLKKRIENLLPKSPPFFDTKKITDRPVIFFVSEIIREKIFLYYQKEIPYSVEVRIDFFNEVKNLIRIKAVIIVERNSQKGIIIGEKGSALKKICSLARKDIESFVSKKVFLETKVCVKKKWRNKKNLLKCFGY